MIPLQIAVGLGLAKSGVLIDGMDPDAAAYIAVTGATDTEAIAAWVVGVKALGLWDAMTCWPMLPGQNHGSGVTVAGLGGTTGNMTLVADPTWESDGVALNGVDQYGDTPFDFAWNSSALLMVAAKRLVTGTNPRLFGGVGRADGPLYLRGPGASSGAFNGTVYNGFTVPANGAFHLFSHALDGSNFRHVLNATAGSLAYTPTTLVMPSLQLGAGQTADNYWNGRIAFASRFAANVTESQILALHVLYKSTLGAGLSLP